MQLTRLLYVKSEVEVSLMVAIVERSDLQECYFWLEELIQSGFAVDQLLWKIFYDFYFEYHSKMEYYIRRKLNGGRDAYHIVRQFFELTASPTVFRRRMAGDNPLTLTELAERYGGGDNIAEYWEGSTYANKSHHMLAMETHLNVPEDELVPAIYVIKSTFPNATSFAKLPARNVLSYGRRYAIRSDIKLLVPERTVAADAPFHNWEYYAYTTLCWKKRFDAYDATPNHLLKRIEFPDDERLEAFYDLYGYEPDEQSLFVQQLSHCTLLNKIEINILQTDYQKPW
jgi:hypothetical protein